MRLRVDSPLVLLPAVLAVLACVRKDGDAVEASQGSSVAAEQVVAQVDGRRITLAELDQRVDQQLSALEQQIYDVRSEGLKEMIGEVLLEKEAKSRGLSVDDLLVKEVDEKVPAPSS